MGKDESSKEWKDAMLAESIATFNLGIVLEAQVRTLRNLSWFTCGIADVAGKRERYVGRVPIGP